MFSLSKIQQEHVAAAVCSGRLPAGTAQRSLTAAGAATPADATLIQQTTVRGTVETRAAAPAAGQRRACWLGSRPG